METIKGDMRRWKNQNASLVAKHEADRSLIKNLYQLSNLLKDEFIAITSSRNDTL